MVKQGKMSTKNCPTDKKLSDIFTKPLQSSKFNMFRRVIMGWYGIAPLWDDLNINGKESSTSKEIVEYTGNIVDADDGNTYGRTCSELVSRGMIG